MEDSHISKVTSPLQELSVLSMEDIRISKVTSPFSRIVSAFYANGRQHLYANFPVEYFLFVILISDILYINDSICIVTPPFKYYV